MAEKVILAEIDINIDAVLSRQKEILDQQTKLKASQDEYNKKKKDGKEITEAETTAYIQNQAELKNLSTEYSQNTKILSVNQKIQADGIKTISDARLALSAVSIEWARVTKVEGENSQRSKELADQKLALTERLKELESSTGDNTRSVGGYKDALKKLEDELESINKKITDNINAQNFDSEETKALMIRKKELSGELDTLKSATDDNTGALDFFANKLGPVGDGLKNLATGGKGFSGSLTTIGNTMNKLIVNPFFAIIATVATIFILIKEAIGKNAEIMDKLAVALKPVQLLFGKIMDVVGKLIEVLVGGFADAMEWVAGLFDGASDSTKKYIDAVKNLHDIEDEMLNLKLRGIQAQQDINKLDEISLDKSKTKKERIDALSQSIEKQKQIAQEEADLQKRQLQNFATDLQGTYGMKGALVTKDFQLTQEALQRLSEEDKKNLTTQIENYLNAQNKKSEIDKGTVKKRSTLMEGIEAEEKAAADKAVEDQKKRNEKVIKLLEYKSTYYKATNETLLKDGAVIDDKLIAAETERLKTIQDLDTAANDKALKLGLKSKEDYALRKIEIDKAYSAGELEIANKALEQQQAVLDLQIREFQATNESKLKSAKELNDTLVADEILRLEQLKVLEQEKINISTLGAEEKRVALLELETSTQNQIADLELQHSEQKKALATEQKLLQTDAENEIKRNGLLSQYEVERSEANKLYDEKIQKAQGNAAAITAIEAARAEAIKNINRKELDQKLTLASGFANNLATIFGKQTKAGKAAASAAVAIDTISGAIKAFNSMASIPVVGTVLGAAAAAAVGVMGAKSIQDIWAVKSDLPENGPGSKPPPPSINPPSAPPTPVEPKNYDGGFANNIVGNGNTGTNQTGTTQTVLVVDDVTYKQNMIDKTNKLATI